MGAKKKMFEKLIIFFLFPAVLILQSCATISNDNYSIEKKIEGRFSIALSQRKQSTQGRFLWKISSRNNSKIEEFYLMDPWGKTRGILMRTIEVEKSPWILLNPNYKIIKNKHVEIWLKKEFELSSVQFSALSLPISIASSRINEYFQKKSINSLIKVVSKTNLGTITINLLPDK